MRLLNRVTSLSTTSFSKPILFFCIVALTPALIFNSLIITGCTTTAPTIRNYFLVQFKYNTESEFYKNLIEAELEAEVGDGKGDAGVNSVEKKEDQIITTLSFPQTSRLRSKRQSDRLVRIDDTFKEEIDKKDDEPTKTDPEEDPEEDPKEEEEPEEEPKDEKETIAPAPAEDRPPTVPVPGPSSPRFSQIRIGYRGICVEHTDGWDCASSHELLAHKDLSSDPSNLVTIADLYLDKISWSAPFWISLVTIAISYILIALNAIPIPCVSMPLWTKKIAVASLGIAAASTMGSMILSGTTAGAVSTLISTITLEAIEVHTGRAVLISGWATFALVILPFLALSALVAAEWGVGKARTTFTNKADEVLEKATGGRYDTNDVRGIRRDFTGGSLRSGTLRGGLAPVHRQAEGTFPTNPTGADRAKQALEIAQKMMEGRGKSGQTVGLGVFIPKGASGSGVAK